VNTLDIGKSDAEGNCFYSQIIGGVAYGPGALKRFVCPDWVNLRVAEDRRSGSKRSWCVVFDISIPGVYSYCGVAHGNRSTANGFFGRTVTGELLKIASDSDCHKRLCELHPVYGDIEAARQEAAALKAKMEAERTLREQQEMAERAAEWQRELNGKRAQAEIAREELKQVGVTLPRLTGTPKQCAWANDLRAAYALKHPGSDSLAAQTSAKWWIENAR